MVVYYENVSEGMKKNSSGGKGEQQRVNEAQRNLGGMLLKTGSPRNKRGWTLASEYRLVQSLEKNWGYERKKEGKENDRNLNNQ